MNAKENWHFFKNYISFVDAGGFENFYNVILKIVDFENKIQRYNQATAYISVNGEQIYRG